MRIHVVRPGDTIYTISRRYGTTPQKIISDNELTQPNQLVVGQTIVVFEAPRTHIVAPGDTLYSIGKLYDVTQAEILASNPLISNPDWLQVGLIIHIPPRSIRFGSIEVNGYAFPNIDRTVLQKTLPNLTYLSIFSYQVKPDGSLIPIEDQPLIQAARAAGVAPLMVISNIEEGGSFSSEIGHTILNDSSIQDKLLDNVVKTLKDKNYYGLDIDFEYLYPADREKYNDFLRKVVARLKPMNYTVTTALAPKTSADQKGLLYEAHDYPVHGALVNHVILMTYEWGYTYSPPMAVAPVNEIRKVLQYAVSAIPRQKIFMGIPNYGYDWMIPHQQGTAAKTVSNTEAVDIARRQGVAISYDTQSQAPFFRYYDGSRQGHEVWFEDARSIMAKLALANSFRVGGLSYWTIGRYFPQNWLILKNVYDIKKVL